MGGGELVFRWLGRFGVGCLVVRFGSFRWLEEVVWWLFQRWRSGGFEEEVRLVWSGGGLSFRWWFVVLGLVVLSCCNSDGYGSGWFGWSGKKNMGSDSGGVPPENGF
uniref:Uncharacterized protein n=1 Tax=Solanum tuberosum TaxID=4113 RepID=M1D6B2_SOLTU